MKEELLNGEKDEVEILLREVAASKSKNVTARIGVNDMHKEIVVKSMNITKEEKNLSSFVKLKNEPDKEVNRTMQRTKRTKKGS